LPLITTLRKPSLSLPHFVRSPNKRVFGYVPSAFRPSLSLSLRTSNARKALSAIEQNGVDKNE